MATIGTALALSAALLSAAGCAAPTPQLTSGEAAQGRALRFRVLAGGTLSGITGAEERVARSRDEWQRLWQAHEAGAVPERSLPAVDFPRELCVGIFAGQRPTGGFAVVVEQVTESASGIDVAYRVTGPPPGAMVPQVLTSPFVIIAVESRPGPVRFQRLAER